MGVNVRPVSESAKKFTQRAGAARGDYAAGVAGAGARWQAGAEASEEAHRQGVQEALNDGRFVKGIRKAGQKKYQDNATKLGPDRFVTGVANAEQSYAAAVQPYQAALASATLPVRGARGSAANASRVTAVMDVMRATRRAQLG